MDWYQLSVKDVFESLKTTGGGLSEEEVRNRLAEYGPNELAEEEKTSKFKNSGIPCSTIGNLCACTPVGLQDGTDQSGEWLRILTVSAMVIIVVEVDKWIRRLKKKK